MIEVLKKKHCIAAGVTGDGKSTIARLVEEENRDLRRGAGFRNLMNFIALDDEADRTLRRQAHTRDSVPAAGERVRLRSISNISSGGTALDVTDIIHPDNVLLAIRAAKALELSVAGIDFMSPDISKSWHEVGGGICEVNAVVGLRPHLLAKPEMDILGPIIETVYPGRQNGRIPTAMITGTKGKSTTTRMLGRILSCAGHTVGAVTTDGVTIGEEDVAKAISRATPAPQSCCAIPRSRPRYWKQLAAGLSRPACIWIGAMSRP